MARLHAESQARSANQRKANQHKPTPPDEEIEEHVRFFFSLRGMTDQKIADRVIKFVDADRYGLSAKSIQRLRKRLGLQGTRQQKHTFESIVQHVIDVKLEFPAKGAQGMQDTLRARFGIRAPVPLILSVLKTLEPEAVESRAGRGFIRRYFYSAGCNALWVMDQHDKWIRYGLYLHNCLDPYSGWNLWMRVWWSNRNPRLISSYYLAAVREEKAVPLITQSDPGSENYNIANMQTIARHEMDPSLAGTLQHRFKRHKLNVKAESNWSVFRKTFAPGFQNLFQHGLDQGFYDPGNPLQRLLFQWLVIPWLQRRLNEWVHERNHNPPRANKRKLMPHGPPVDIRVFPEMYKSHDFKIGVKSLLLDELEQKFAPPDNEVFKLCPPLFHEQAVYIYDSLPSQYLDSGVSFETLWPIFNTMLQQFVALGEQRVAIDNELSVNLSRLVMDENAGREPATRLPDFHEIPNNELVETSGAYQVAVQDTRLDADGKTLSQSNSLERSDVDLSVIYAEGDEYVDYLSDEELFRDDD